ncbi:phage tail spike protein, partial [Enterococcus hirae]|uniref:phage tail spike protein n=1 Tax=Enterococcus hirae TaxID=1354 RepID=UPI0039A40BD4
IDDTATTYETIKEKCLETFGGEIRIRRGEGVNFIDWLNSSGMNGSQTIELKKNMLSVSRTMDPNEIITILKPRGARIEAPEGETSDVSMPRITIEKVNNGRDYLIDEQKRARFGSIAGSVVWDDVHEPDILLAKAKQWLASQKVSTNQFQISAVDLFPIGLAVDQFEVGNWHVVKNKWLGLDENIRIVGMQLKLNELEKSTLTFGNKLKTQEQYNADISSAKSAVTTMASGVEQQQANIITINKNLNTEVANLRNNFDDLNYSYEKMDEAFTSITNDFGQRITALENIINGGSGNGGI